MSLVLQQPLCPKCKRVASEFSRKHNTALCTTHGTFFWHPAPEPTIEELNHQINLIGRKKQFYENLLTPTKYDELVNFSLDRITREKAYLEHLRSEHSAAPGKLQEVEVELKSLEDQRKALINEKQTQTREVNHRRSGTSTKPSSNEKLRERLGPAVYDKLLSILGSEEKVREALKV